MTPGKSLTLSNILPNGITVDDFYITLTAVAAFIIVWSLGVTIGKRDKVQPRLKAIHSRREELKAAYLAPKEDSKATDQHKTPPNWMKQMVDKLANLKGDQIAKLNQRLIQAGNHSKGAATVFMFTKLVTPFIGLAIGFLVAKIDWSNAFSIDQAANWLGVIICGYLGAVLPDLLLYNKRQKRYGEIRIALPDTLDLMLICAEAGLSLSAALDRVTRELGNAYPEMADELGYTSVEIGFLPERSLALTHLAHRVDIQEIRGIVNVLQQTEKYGTPIGQALRVLSKEFRTERMLRAEQKAAQLPAIMTIPLILFILPTLFVIVLTPAIIGILNSQ
ncbi:MAG: type II secretion system F family protein [Rickettsiales bacterium]|nr:type II secretion system F family protein [Rickettsiales bacterium]